MMVLARSGYISGILDASAVIFTVKPSATLFCLPKTGISPEEVLSIVALFSELEPNIAKDTARTGIIIALTKAYPCN